MSLEEKIEKLQKQSEQIEVYSRIVGYYRNVKNWNKGKKQEFKERKVYNEGSD